MLEEICFGQDPILQRLLGESSHFGGDRILLSIGKGLDRSRKLIIISTQKKDKETKC